MDTGNTNYNLNEKISFLQELLLFNNNIYFWKFSLDKQLIYCNCSQANIFMNYLFLDMSPATFQNLKSNKINIYSSNIGLFWVLIPFSKCEEEYLYVLGPVFSQEIDEKNFKKRMDVNQMTISSQLKFSKLLNKIPVVSNNNFRGFAAMLYFTLYNKKACADDITMLVADHNPAENDYDVTTHGTYAWEQHFLKCVEEGNLNYKEELDFLFGHVIANQVEGILSSNPVRQAQNQAIIATALVMRAAIRGGMNSEMAYSLSDYYIQHIENCTCEMDAQQLLYQMYDSFIQKVHAIRQTSPLTNIVEQCCTLIIQNLNNNLHLNDIAQTLGFTPYYLSAMFKKETGKSINTYITERKIERAKYLLTSTTLSILDISNELSFSTPSYFSYNFKKLVGQTPQQFRKNSNHS